MNYVKSAPEGVTSDDRDKAMELAKPLTPRSERPRKSWGSLLVQIPTKGLCSVEAKCLRRAGHGGTHWPRSET